MSKELEVRKVDSPADKLLESPVKNPPTGMQKGFYVKGDTVCYRSQYFLFGEDPVDEAPEEILLVARHVVGRYGSVLSAQGVAKIIAGTLNKAQTEFLNSPSSLSR